MNIKINEDQMRQVRAMTEGLCKYCSKDHCCDIISESGEKKECIQFIVEQGIYCCHFFEKVLPINSELYSQIIKDNWR